MLDGVLWAVNFDTQKSIDSRRIAQDSRQLLIER